MQFYSFCAPSKTGKTTFLEKLIPILIQKKLRVGTLKHCHHPLVENDAFSDSGRLRKAGALPSIAISGTGSIRSLQKHFLECDLVLVEGFRQALLPTFLLHRGRIDPTWTKPQNIIATIDISEISNALSLCLEHLCNTKPRTEND